ncbi:MAG TPA: hypothetical protein VKI65_15220 [Gemmataceae bacterium]|nr:hypothetical protein [Gemmataceae bacterium]
MSGNPSNCAEADTAASANVVADDRAATANALAEIPLTQRLGGAAQGAFPGQPDGGTHPPPTLDGHVILGELGRGGMGGRL